MYCESCVAGMGILIMASGVPVYLICVSWKKKPEGFYEIMGEWRGEGGRKREEGDMGGGACGRAGGGRGMWGGPDDGGGRRGGGCEEGRERG